ncbi:signal recognition particle protein [Candidatus Pacearchaeota archaeon]|nr:signal recognition particle protein [Candidatus Pacearchaeota archaeon]
MLESLGNALKKTTDKIANAVLLDKKLVDSIIKDLQRALLEADVNVALVIQLTDKIKKAALDTRVSGIEKKEHIIKLLHDELIKILGTKKDLVLGKKDKIMLVGLYGAGKTTTISKIASYYKKRGHNVCAIGLDVHRPAAPEQLKQACDKVDVPAFIDEKEKNPALIWKKYQDKLKPYDLILIDTAGRDALSDDLIKEIRYIHTLIKPSETLLVMPADIGQSAKAQAKAFKESAKITGVIITRMDSTAKAGGALTACSEAKVPVVFMGTGEKPSDLETFDPESFLSRLLGMGDLKTLIEKIHSSMDQKTLEKQQSRISEGKLTMKDLIDQIETMGSMGGIGKITSMIPGLGKATEKLGEEKLEEQEQKIKQYRNIYDSMTQEEKLDPQILEKQTSRIQRIAKGSGTTTAQVRALLKQYKMLSEMIKSQSDMTSGKIDQKTLMKLAKKFGKKMKF